LRLLFQRGWRTSKLSHEAQRDLLNWTPEEQRQQWRADKLAMQKPILDAVSEAPEAKRTEYSGLNTLCGIANLAASLCWALCCTAR